MKRLLLTLLGAAALCGLSPHPAQAQNLELQKKTVTFQGWHDQNPEFRYSRQMKFAHEQTTTAISQTKYDASLDESLTPQPLPSSAWSDPLPYAQGQINWGEVQMEMDYSNAAYSCNNNNKATYWTSAVQDDRTEWSKTWKYTSSILPSQSWMNIYPGVDIKFSVPGKRIKKVTIHTGLPTIQPASPKNSPFFNQHKMASNLRIIDKLGSDKNTKASVKATMQFVDNNGKADIELTSTELFGSKDGINLKVNGFEGMIYNSSTYY